MRTDIPRLMQERNIDALVIDAPDGLGESNSPFLYFVGGAHVTQARIIVTPTQTYLLHGAMERDEAAKAAARTGMTCVDASRFRTANLVKQFAGKRLDLELEILKRQFAELGVGGRVGFYGAAHQNQSWALLNRLAREEICEVVGEFEDDVISKARETKDAGEVALIREACRMTENVIGATKDYLQSQAVKNGALMKADDEPLTIGDAKRFIRLQMVREGLEPNEMIFSIGRDAGIGHSAGTSTDIVALGKTIVFDIFPRQPGSYFADITRTWCLGFAPDHVLQGYEQVMDVHASVAAMFDAARPSSDYQEAACDIFERYGHPTIRKDGLGITSGYYHSLGHGIGLSVHEAPGMRNALYGPSQPLAPGAVVTHEPGLYYPDDPRGGWGVRVEDDYWLNPDTLTVECLTGYDRSLVVPM